MTRRSASLVAAAVTGAALILPFRTLFPDCSRHRGFLDRDPVDLRVLAPVQSGPLVTELATKTFLTTRPEIGGRCIVVHVDEMFSGDAERALARGWATPQDRPDVWMPLTRTWVDLLRKDLLRKGAPPLVPDDVPVIDRTPEVIAMPEPMAIALGWSREVGWSGTRIGWKDIYDLAQNPEGWKSKGHEEWGRFWLARTNPNASTSGLYSTIAAYYAGKRKAGLRNPLDLTSGDLDDARVVDFVKGVESSVLFYGDSSLNMLPRLYDATLRDEATQFVSAITVAETSVVNYNLGYPTGEAGGKKREKRDVPRVRLVALYPREGTLFADLGYVMLNWLEGDKRVAAEKLLRFLQSETAQRRFQEHGFRKPDGAEDDVLKGGPWITADVRTVTRLEPPDPDVVMAVRDSWAGRRKRARLLIVVDLSEPASRIERVQLAAETVLNERLHPEDELGLWALSPGDPSYLELAPLAPLGMQPNRLQATGPWLPGAPGTRLYVALQEAIGRFVDAKKINGIVFLTDGRHNEPGNLNTFLEDLAERRHLGVRVFPIGFGKDVDCRALRAVADTSRTKASCHATSETFEKIFTEVVKNF
ncbi:MAG TPA: substrate-binding domain-containing protein [Acidimicrobiia bacterium]|nr:substrate-binding domain-containing protein [Acidimicrobiia bacterium]